MSDSINTLLAPNGKPSNLTPEQYKLVRTPAFKQWFGDWEKIAEAKIKDSGLDDSTFELLGRNVSKVVDENGEPLVVYRGMAEQSSKKYTFSYNYYQIKQFDRKNKFGFYFTDSYDVAMGYAKEHSQYKILEKAKNIYKAGFDNPKEFYDYADSKARVISYFINIRKCLDLKKYESLSYVELLKILNVNDFEISKFIEKYFKPYQNKLAYEKDVVYSLFITQKEKGKDIEDSIGIYFKNKILEKYDGVVFEEKTFGKSDVYVAFYPNQIKLADGSNTTFDPNNPDIRFEDGGLTHSLNQSMNNLTKNGIVITDEKSGIMAILYNTGNQSRKLGLYNTSLLYKTISEIDKDAASRIVVNINQGIFDEFDKDNIGKYKNSKILFIFNQNEVLYNSNNPDIRFEKGGVFDENINVPSTEELIEIVRNVREKKIKEWYKLGERVVVGRNDGYWWEISPTESESILARNPSKKKVLEIIKNNPNITEIHFNGSIKTGTKVGEELEIADDFDVVIWKKQEQIVLPNNADIFQEGLSFAYVDDKGKFINVIVNAKDTQRYSQIDETDLSDKYIYVLSYNKENKNTFDYRIVKEEFKEGVNDGDIVFTKEKFKDGGEIKVNDMKSEISVSDIDRKYSNLSHKFINKQLMMGIEIEMEHTDNPEVAKKIALDHLNESPYYYQELEKMESRLEKKNVDSHFEDIKRAYADGGTTDEMFSFSTPSGEKSKLTYIQQVLVRTSAFKNYFGDWEIAAKRFIKDGRENFEKHFKDVSKVIDFVTFEPRVVYHGTMAEQEFFNFDVTREKGVGRPYAYFAHNKPYAENFTRVSQRQDSNSKPFLYECFLNVRNPFMANSQEFTDKSKDSESWLKAIVGRIVWDKYRTIKRDDFTKAVESTVESQIGNYLEQVYSDRKDKFWKLMARDINKDFKFFLLAYDYDGIFYSEEFSGEYDIENPAQFTYAITIFDARQVKLADGRNTKFDPFNSDVRYADGGATEPIINNTQNENDMNKLEQLSGIMKNGGAIYKDGGSVKGNGKHTNDAKGGGYFDGNSHADGGIKAINKDTGQIIEVEGNEVIINKRSVGDTTKREFEGEMLTNREILSKINESGGGVKFADGGEMEHSTCGCSGKKYKYGGETLEDYVILHRISKSTSPKEDSQNLIKQVYG